MNLYLRSGTILEKALTPCPHGGGGACIMHGGDGRTGHRGHPHGPGGWTASPSHGHEILARHFAATDSDQGRYDLENETKPLKRPLPREHAADLAHAVVHNSNQYLHDPEKFDALHPEHQSKIMDGLKAAQGVLRSHTRYLARSAPRDEWNDIPRGHQNVIDMHRAMASEASDVHRQLKFRNQFKDLVEERKRYKTPVGHLKKGAKDKGTNIEARVGGVQVPDSLDLTHEAVFHKLFGDHSFDEVHGAFSMDHPKYETKISELDLHHGSNSTEGSLRGTVRDKKTGAVVSDPDFSRRFTRDRDGRLHVYHSHFFINKNHQNHGIVNKVFKNSVKFYQGSGVSDMETQPVEVGRFTWPRIGFHWGDSGNQAARQQLPMYLRDHHKMDREQRHKITAEIAHKPWEVAQMMLPLPEKGSSSDNPDRYGSYDYIGRKDNPRKPGETKFIYHNPVLSHYLGGKLVEIEGTNAPKDHPDHDPSRGDPLINAGKDFLLSKHGDHVWNAAGHGYINLDHKDPGYQNLCRYLGLDPKNSTAPEQELASYHTPSPHRMPEREHDEDRAYQRSAPPRRRRGECNNCGEETESQYDAYCPSCQEDKEKRERLEEEKREKKAERRRDEKEQELKERDALEPGGEVRPHHVLDAMPLYRTGASVRIAGGPGAQAAEDLRDYGNTGQNYGPLAKHGTKIRVEDDPRYGGVWQLGSNQHWSPVKVKSGHDHLPWSVLHHLAERGRVFHHGRPDERSYTSRQKTIHQRIHSRMKLKYPRFPSGLHQPEKRKWRKFVEESGLRSWSPQEQAGSKRGGRR